VTDSEIGCDRRSKSHHDAMNVLLLWDADRTLILADGPGAELP
jgi:hypothetical protein